MTGPLIYNGTDYQNQPLVDAWWTRGWTAQTGEYNTTPAANSKFVAPDYIFAIQPGGTPSFPSNLLSVDVTGTYYDPDGNPLPGYLTFIMTDSITIQDPTGTYFRLPARYAGREAGGSAFAQNNWGSGRIYIHLGGMSVNLFQTDSSFMTTDSGNSLWWFVQEHFLGGMQYFITVPGSASPGPVDIHTLIVAGTATPYDYDPVNPRGNGTMPAVP